ncbi:MAG TPA: hypothetical protein QGF58_27570 [Myxococcota bacterium]|nr:hypothetical protein [Myxococcota bacterium]
MILLLACVATVPSLPSEPVDSEQRLDSEPIDSEDTGYTPDEYDCDDLPDFNLGSEVLDHARGYHGNAFDDEGNIIGWDPERDALVKASYDGDSDTWLPGLTSVEQITRNSAGDLYFVDSSRAAVFRVTPEGGQERLTGGLLSGYGITFGPDGMLYVSDGNVVRIDPETGDKETIVKMPDGGNSWTAHAVDWNLDSTRLYIATVPYGDLLQVELDENLDPIGEPEMLLRLPGYWLDAVRVDACDNLWVAEFAELSLYRINDRGEWDEMVDGDRSRYYGHGIVWGTGHDGWRADALYQPLPYNSSKVQEVIIGVPDGNTVRTWKGEPVEY